MTQWLHCILPRATHLRGGRTAIRMFCAALLLVGVSKPLAGQSETRQNPDSTPPPTAPVIIQMPLIQRSRLLNNLMVLVAERTAQPNVTVHLMIKCGATNDLAGKAGLAELASRWVEAHLLGQPIEDRGGEVATTLGPSLENLRASGVEFRRAVDYDSTHFALSGPPKQFGRMMDLLGSAFLQTSLSASSEAETADFARVKQTLLQEIKSANATELARALQAFREKVFGTHPFAFATTGDELSVNSLTLPDVEEFIRKFYLPNNALLVMVGSVKSEAALKSARENFGGWRQRHFEELPNKRPEPIRGVGIVLVDHPGSTKATIALGGLGTSRTSRDDFAIQVLNQIFGGSNASRLNQRLREEASLVEKVSSRFEPHVETGPYVVLAETEIAKSIPTLHTIFAEMRKLRENPLREQELDAAKQELIDRHRVRYRSNEQLAEQLAEVERFRLASDYHFAYRLNIERVTDDAVRAAAGRYFNPDNVAVAIVADAAQISLSELQALGKVEMLRWTTPEKTPPPSDEKRNFEIQID